MGADLGLATRLRRAGLAVREIDGWQNRSNSSGLAAFNPKGGVMHHTAGHPSNTSPAPSLNICIHGRDDLPGPLCNVLLGFNGVFYVIAAGPANHAGLPDGGSIKGMTGNSTAWGMEIEHDGLHPLPDRLVLLAARGWAAIFRKGDIGAGQCVQHREWAPSRKIDVATNLHGAAPEPSADRFRVMVRREKERLTKPDFYIVSYLRNKDLQLVKTKINRPDNWTDSHGDAFRRGNVEFKPVRN
jgi:N-acetylmuramoyl-L-alanine amidase.